MAEKTNGNGVYVEVTGEKEAENLKQKKGRSTMTLPEVLNRLASAILSPEPGNTGSLIQRIKISVADNAPFLPEASRNSARSVIIWTRRGSPLRAILVISGGTVALISMTALLVFMLFLAAATVNAIVISLLVSLAAAGGFLALFFASVTAIYIGALSVAAFAISVTAFWAIVATLITAGWIGFFFTVWLVTRKSFEFAKHSLSVTGSAISSYSATRHAHRHTHKD